MVLYHGKPFPPSSNLVPPTVKQIDAILKTLRDSSDAEERLNAFGPLRAAPRDLIRQRMNVVRPWNPMADPFQQGTHFGLSGEAKNCVCLIGSQGYEDIVAACIESLARHGGKSFRVLLFCVGEMFYKWALSQYFGQGFVSPNLIRATGRVTTWIKTVQLLAPEVMTAENYVLLEADTLVLQNLDTLFAQMDACPNNTIFGVQPNNPFHLLPMENHVTFLNGGIAEDVEWICGTPKTAAKFLFNGGLYAGKAEALRTLSKNLASLWPFSVLWAEGATAQRYGEEVMTNWAISMPNLETVTLDSSWNDQSCAEFKHLGHTEMAVSDAGVRFTRDGHRSKILHVLGDRALAEPRPFFWEAKRALDEYGLAA